jgi:hypothetical protein
MNEQQKVSQCLVSAALGADLGTGEVSQSSEKPDRQQPGVESC